MLISAFTITAAFLAAGKECVEVKPAQCGTSKSGSGCLKCGTASDYDCEQCCPDCKRVQAPPYSYCECGAPAPPPTPPEDRYVSANMTWNGKLRRYDMHIPLKTAPTGLIVAIGGGVGNDYVGTWCKSAALRNVTVATGAITACAAAQDLGPAPKTNGTGPCWKAFANYGTCQLKPDGGMIPEDSEDVDFLAALVTRLTDEFSVNQSRVVLAGHSNGGSMAYRFYCERAEMLGGLVVQSQSYLDPYVGFYDYVHDRVPTGTPQCHPAFKRPFYSDVGTEDVYYAASGFPDWLHNFSTQVLGCTGEAATTSSGPPTLPGYSAGGKGPIEELPATCYDFPPGACPGLAPPAINRFCSVDGLSHDDTPLSKLLPRAFAEFFY